MSELDSAGHKKRHFPDIMPEKFFPLSEKKSLLIWKDFED